MKWRAFGRTPQWVRLSDWLASAAAEALGVCWRDRDLIEAANSEQCKSGLRVQGALRLLGQQPPPAAWPTVPEETGAATGRTRVTR